MQGLNPSLHILGPDTEEQLGQAGHHKLGTKHRKQQPKVLETNGTHAEAGGSTSPGQSELRALQGPGLPAEAPAALSQPPCAWLTGLTAGGKRRQASGYRMAETEGESPTSKGKSPKSVLNSSQILG